MQHARPATLVASIRERVETWPDGRLWSRFRRSRSQTYAALWERSARIATGLSGIGAAEGRPVVLLMHDMQDFVPAFWACLRCGAMAVPLSGAALLKGQDRTNATFGDALARLDRPVILFSASFARIVERLRHDSEATFLPLGEAEASPPLLDDRPAAEPACLIPTSGSTGRLKLAALSEPALLHRYRGFAGKLRNPLPMRLSLLPPDGITGLQTALIFVKNQFYLPLATFAAEPMVLLDIAEQHAVSVMTMTSALIQVLLREAGGDSEGAARRRDLSGLTAVAIGAEPIVPETVRRLRDLLVRHGASNVSFDAGYGTTETGLLAAGASPLDATGDEASPIGACSRGVALRIVDADGAPLADGAVGEVQAHRPGAMFLGYWGEPEATRAGFTADGWWRTGDLGCLREGVLTLHGRAKEVVILNGRKHSLADIDAHLQSELGTGIRAYSCAVRASGEPHERLVVVFVDEDGAGAAASLVERIATAVGRRFGIPAQAVACSDPALIPVTAGGKLRRSELGRRVLSGFYGQEPRAVTPPPHEDRDTIDARVARLWRETLQLSEPLDPHANFFALGGDSLRAMRLSAAIEGAFARHVSPEAFFAAPTLATLQRLVDETEDGVPDEGGEGSDSDVLPVAWPLPEDLRHRQLGIVESWKGTRPTRGRLAVGLNVDGARAPLFFICQGEGELRLLADRLGPDQPIYGLRSGGGLIGYTENEIQTLALRYAEEIAEVCPHDTLFLGGFCQGGVIALAIAQHLLRRGRHIPLLVLIEWGFALQAYGGKVLLVHGQDSRDNPRRRYRDPEAVWRRCFEACESIEVPGGHFVMENGSVNAVGGMLMRALTAAQSEPPRLLTRTACRAELAAPAPPTRMRAGQTCLVRIDIRNRGRFAWPSEPLGLVLRNAWSDADGTIVKRMDGRVALPVLDAGACASVLLPVTAPNVNGALRLIVDLAEEGRAWRGVIGKETLHLAVAVGDGPAANGTEPVP